MQTPTLDAYLDAATGGEIGTPDAVAQLVRRLAEAASSVRDSINLGALGAAFAETRGGVGAGGDIQKDLDVFADDIFLRAARNAPVALYGSEELEHPVLLDKAAPLALAIDPLDGSSNIDTNVSIGTIFSILPVRGPGETELLQSFLQPGSAALAAGFFIYGPQLSLALTLGRGTRIFVFSSRLNTFVEAYADIAIPQRAQEFAINASNYRHWDPPVRAYIEECFNGAGGAHATDYNMRWVASMVADAYRILIRGGVYLYPSDARKGYHRGRLRLVYEAIPIAMLVEQAGGAATDCTSRILDLVPETLHQHTPLVFGSATEVHRIARYHAEPDGLVERSPLFGNRGLFRS